MSHSSGRSFVDVVLLAKVGAGAISGGLLATGVLWLFGYLDQPAFTAVLVLAMAVFCVMAAGSLQSAEHRRRLDRTRYPQPPVYAAGPRAVDRPAPVPVAPPAPQHTWHLAAARDSLARGSAPTAVSAPPPPVDPDPEPGPARVAEVRVPGRSGGVRRVVQCPRCAEFDITVAEEAGGFAFGCRGCRHTWRWTPGRPWPPTVARPALAHRRGSRPPA
jgi:hypothetical protein